MSVAPLDLAAVSLRPTKEKMGRSRQVHGGAAGRALDDVDAKASDVLGVPDGTEECNRWAATFSVTQTYLQNTTHANSKPAHGHEQENRSRRKTEGETEPKKNRDT